MTFFPKRGASHFRGRAEILNKRPSTLTPNGARMRTFIASLIESSDFFGIFAKVVQIMASQSPSFSVA
jgi:hypothetical protein